MLQALDGQRSLTSHDTYVQLSVRYRARHAGKKAAVYVMFTPDAIKPAAALCLRRRPGPDDDGHRDVITLRRVSV